MMDMMTIILVFLLKSLSSSPANVPQSDDLRLPHSTVNTSPSQALQVIVSRVSITVNGRFITSLRNGYVDPSQKRAKRVLKRLVRDPDALMRHSVRAGE